MKICRILGVGLAIFSIGAFAGIAYADPITWVMTGTLTSVGDSGVLAANGVNASAGDPFTLTYTYDPTVAPSSSGVNYTEWVEQNRSSLTLQFDGGMWSSSAAGQYFDDVQNNGNAVEEVISENYTVDSNGEQYDSIPFTSNVNTGITPTYLNSFLYFIFQGSNDSLSGTNWPSTINVADWQQAAIQLYLNESNSSTGQNAEYLIQGTITDVSVEAVPTPASLALLALGLIGIGGLCRKAKAA